MKQAFVAMGILLIVATGLGFVSSTLDNPTPAMNLQTAREATVIITDGIGHGSGVHIGNGIILTAGHCVDINDTWVETFDGRTYTIVKKWRDTHDEDIGFVQIRRTDLPVIKFGNLPTIGDTVYVIGTPLERYIRMNVTKGIVSNLHIDIETIWYDTMIVDAAAYPGNSGGPVLNSKFELIGILVGAYISYDNLSICEPINDIENVFEVFNEL